MVFSINYFTDIKQYDNDKLKNYLISELIDNTMDTLKEKKIEAVRKYMVEAVEKRNLPKDTLSLSPEKLVNACEETGFDLPLLLAQAHLESCFGVTVRARKTNSVWSVGSEDGGKNRYTYKTQDESIMPYIKLMKDNYLDGKSVDDILKPGKFVNKNGHRYARDPYYEVKVRSLRNKILKDYPELNEKEKEG